MRDSMLTRTQRRDASDSYYPVRRAAIRLDDEDKAGTFWGVMVLCLMIGCIFAWAIYQR